MTSAPIRVTIFDHSGEEHCPWRCGVDQSPHALAFITEHLKERYGDSVEVEYIDLATSPREEARQRIKAHNLPLPVVAIDGVFRLAGGVDYRAILEAIEAQRELGR